MDRIFLREDQSTGQRIRAFTVDAQLSQGDGRWFEVAGGTSVGNKAIKLFAQVGGIRLSSLRVRVTAAAERNLTKVRIRQFAAFKW